MGDRRFHSLGKRLRVDSPGGCRKPDERTESAENGGGKGGCSSKSRLDGAGASYSKPDDEAAVAVPVRSKTRPTEVNSAKVPYVDACGGVGRRDLRTSAAQGKEGVSDQMKVKEAVRAFHKIFEEVKGARKSKHVFEKDSGISVFSEALERMKMSKKCVNPGKLRGPVPGVEIGQEFCCRAELVVTGVHGQIVKGIDWVSKDGKPYATSIVESGQYSNCMKSKDEVIYCGEGGNRVFGGRGCLKDQKLSGGNLALRNSMHSNHPVRFVRRYKLTKCGSGPRHANHERLSNCKYVYQGIFYVRRYWIERGPFGKLMYMFRLTRDLTRNSHDGTSNVSRALERVCVDDISRGREKVPIRVSGAVGKDGPSPFNYIVDIIYPEQKDLSPPIGCNCEEGCHSMICSCAIKNGRELPYKQDGRISKFKPLVYECGPYCSCSHSCINRASQSGIKFDLEIFQTRGKGWGVRSRSHIPLGSFVCEYIGKVLPDVLASPEFNKHQYFFNIGVVGATHEENGEYFTIDAKANGNIGRFINHSCSPNLYAQNVLYDHDDKSMPHIKFFASKDILPLTELTFDYTVSHVRCADVLQRMKCYCNTVACKEKRPNEERSR
ncbi:histone-lysine N-methyltransferase, H3 lysine-9 specific SUVH5-like [Rhodamnia argentea]|uniref:Histone-lysine N-methyltransferase, H3 lysine-9 specific SUVH5-like n=1 Tax=Rhodamnia argentea TaxID=178133 RepID=A0A8B8P5Q7_9MYRT|nr:histone-lysine N-methyltransferase, H3 lysine-9 specific SUVH5-like [Rhodamnia argentea]